ncbi:MAG TPA: hypothetical protein PKU77_14005, partial [Ferruginibacter sp.]|nr:hypothetical protein [Ferruginibacter sp.]
RIIGDSVELHLYRANDYDLFPKGKIDSSVVTAERIIFKVMELDQSIFGNRSFKVITDSIFENYFFALNPPTPKIISYKSDPSVVGKQVHMCVRMKGNNCTCGNVCLDWETCNECGYWFCFTIGSAEPPTGGGTYNWPPDPPISIGGGGGGGSSTGNCIPGNCRNGSTLIVEGRIPCGGCGNGPVVVVPPDEPTFNPYYADTVIIDQTLANYPCVTRIIDSLSGYANVNALAQVALHTVFNLAEKIQLTFKADSSLIALGEDGKTNYNTAQTIGDTYYATILLNPITLSSATEEYIASTIIHESIHSYINYQYDRYLTGLIDSNQFKNLFPLYWPKRNSSGTIIVSNSAQHQAMAANMIQIMTQPLVSLFPNASIPPGRRDSVYQALSWAGLEGTYSWSVKPDTSYIRAVNLIAKDTTVNSPFYINGNSNIVYNFDSHNLNMIRGCK